MAYATFFTGEEAETDGAEVFNGYKVCQHVISELMTFPLIIVLESM